MSATPTAGASRDILAGAPAPLLRAEDADLPQSPEFVALRDRAHELVRRVGQLRLRGASAEEIEAAERAAMAAEDAAFGRLLEDRGIIARQRQDHENDERERALLAEQEEATLRRIVLALRDRGPLTGGELEALRIRGASHNLLRPILRVGVTRGLVWRRQDGKRVLWSATPLAWERSPVPATPGEENEDYAPRRAGNDPEPVPGG